LLESIRALFFSLFSQAGLQCSISQKTNQEINFKE